MAKRKTSKSRSKLTLKQRKKAAKRIKNIAATIRKTGAPETYDPHFAKMVKPLAEYGATDDEIADFFSVTTTTIRNWMVRHQEFFVSVQGGKDAWDKRVERSMAQRAVGYTYDSEKIVVADGCVVRVPIREHVPPSEKAAMNWLTNRKRHEWKDRQEHGFDPDTPLKIVVEGGLPK